MTEEPEDVPSFLLELNMRSELLSAPRYKPDNSDNVSLRFLGAKTN